MFGPQSFPQTLNQETQALEEETRRYQAAFMTKGMKANGRQKAFKDMILERPKVPYFTRATESLAAAIEANPLQNHGVTGVLVDESMLAETNDVCLLRVNLPDGEDAILYVYADLSCIIGLRGPDAEKIQVMTLPFKLRTARLSHRDRVRFLKLSIRMKDRATRGGVMASDHDKGAAIRLDAKNSLHADFLHDLGIEIEAVVTQTALDGPIYQITPQKIQESEEDDRGGLILSIGPSWSTALSEAKLGWLCRENVSAFDVHLPAMSMSVDQLIGLQRLSEAAAQLAWKREGLDGKSMRASLMVYAANPISGSQVDFRIQRSAQDLMGDHFEELCKEFGGPDMDDLKGNGHLNRPTLSQEEINRFLKSFYDIFMDAAANIEIYGYKFLYLKGMVGSWVPIIVTDIRLDQLSDSVESVDALSARVAFQRHRLQKLAA